MEYPAVKVKLTKLCNFLIVLIKCLEKIISSYYLEKEAPPPIGVKNHHQLYVEAHEIGTDPSNDIVVRKAFCSRKHATLFVHTISTYGYEFVEIIDNGVRRLIFFL